MLRIVKATDPLTVEQVVICLYGPPGLGKTTLGFTANDPLLLDCDRGAYRAANRKDTVAVPNWKAIESIDTADLAPYKTVILDTAGRALDLLTADIIAANPKMGRGGSLTLQGYGELKARFGSYLRMLRTHGKDVVLLAHMNEERNGDDVIERLDVQGGSKAEIYKSADAMGRLIIRGTERLIDFNPRENSFGKNPCNLPVVPFSLNHPMCLGGIIGVIKERLNASVEVEKKESDSLRDWMIVLSEAADIETMNELLPEILKAGPKVIALANKRARELKLAFDKQTKTYQVSGREAVHA